MNIKCILTYLYLLFCKDGKPSVPLTASCLNTIAEECILILRTLYNKKYIKHKNVTDLSSYFDSLIVWNIISATDYLENPTLEKNVLIYYRKFIF